MEKLGESELDIQRLEGVKTYRKIHEQIGKGKEKQKEKKRGRRKYSKIVRDRENCA